MTMCPLLTCMDAHQPEPNNKLHLIFYNVQLIPLFLSFVVWLVVVAYYERTAPSSRFLANFDPTIGTCPYLFVPCIDCNSATDSSTIHPQGSSLIPYFPMIGGFLAAYLIAVLGIELGRLPSGTGASRFERLVFAMSILSAGTEACLQTVTTTAILKQIVGRLRPDFNQRCFGTAGRQNSPFVECTTEVS